MLRPDGEIVDANDRAVEAYGLPRESLLGRNFVSLRDPATRTEVPAQLALALADDGLRFETTHLRADGSAFPVEVSSRRFTVGDETFLHSLVRDLTEQRRAEHERRLLAAITRQTRDAVILLDTRLRVTGWTGAALAIYGYPEAEALGRHALRDFETQWMEAPFEAHRERLLRGEHTRTWVRVRRGDAVWVDVDLAIDLMRDESGRLIGYFAIGRDITREKAAEQALREREEQLRLANVAARQTTWQYGVVDDTLTFMAGLTQLLPAFAEGGRLTSAQWRDALHPDDAERAYEDVQRYLRGEADHYESEYRLPANGGGYCWVRSRGQAVERDADGHIRRMMGTLADISELHVLQERLTEATRQSALGNLAAGVAHEINNPLSWISANLAYVSERVAELSDAALRRDLTEVLSEAVQGAERIAGVVKAMRSLGRGRATDTIQPVNVRSELTWALSMIRNQAKHRAIVSVDIAPGLPWTRAQPYDLRQAFLHLLLNAVEAIPEGHALEHHIDVCAFAEGGFVVVEVRDSGVGVPPDVLPRIFEPFFTTRDVGAGSGLGLPLAKTAVEATGGRLEVESQPGVGTTFRAFLPSLERGGTDPLPTIRTGEGGQRRVLVIDDEPIIGRAVARTLGNRYAVTPVTSARDALERLDRGERWDAILCDVMMPEMDGPAFFEALERSHPDLVPRLSFMTGEAFGDRAEAFLAESRLPVLHKPIPRETLVRVVDALTAGSTG
ncbi:PAS domain S-box protein [Myxococcota bacterium]|nr:PAS domain S-box protein [Myxococcota bacterium]